MLLGSCSFKPRVFKKSKKKGGQGQLSLAPLEGSLDVETTDGIPVWLWDILFFTSPLLFQTDLAWIFFFLPLAHVGLIREGTEMERSKTQPEMCQEVSKVQHLGSESLTL